MRVNIIIPTKDGGEGFQRLFKCIKDSILYSKKKNPKIKYSVSIAINGDQQKPLKFLHALENDDFHFKIYVCPRLGKVNAIEYASYKNKKGNYLILIDDDVTFSESLIYEAIRDLETNRNLKIISYQNQVLPYRGRGRLKKFVYDIINIRSLKKLYLDVDPFLFGRFMTLRGNTLPVPNCILLEDLYLSILFDGQILIKKKCIYYEGLSSLTQHIKRVIMLETARNQIKNIFGAKYYQVVRRNRRVIDQKRLQCLNFYYQLCFFLYKLLRFFTNMVLAKIVRHKTAYW